MNNGKESRIPVRQAGTWIYDIVLTDSFGELRAEMEKLGPENRKLCIITDSNVAPLYLSQVEELLSGCFRQVTSFVIPAGEENKNLQTVQTVYEHLIRNHYDRKDLLAALGGGVVGDLCGFAAATYLRGVDFIQIPTTLLSQVDSGIGGKTGVDFDAYKNMVGAFHMPKLVYTNVSTLQTLPKEQFSAGMGEVIKHGLIRDKEYFTWLWNNREAIQNLNPEALHRMIQESDLIKRAVVEADPTEQNERATLNFGHTLGHAIEKLNNFTLLHGHCVALGALAAMKLCQARGLVSENEVKAYEAAMEAYGIPTRIRGLKKEDVIAATRSDKKMEAGVIKFILLRQVGEAYIDRAVTDTEMGEALNYIMEEPEF